MAAMRLVQRAGPRLRQRQERNRRPLTQSLFPFIDVMIQEKEYREALQFVGCMQGGRYNSLVDRLFCRLFPECKPLCDDFYRGNAAELRFLAIANDEQVRDWSARMTAALIYARETCRQRRTKGEGPITWDDFLVLLTTTTSVK